MKLKWIVICCGALLLLAGGARAAHVWDNPDAWASSAVSYAPNRGPLFSDKELSLDLFGSYIAPEGKFKDLFKTNIRHGDWGGGVGLNYFLTKYLGIGGD